MTPLPDHGEQSYKGLARLAGRAALITGGDSGIGRAVAIAFAREGADVAFSYLDEEDDAQETRHWIERAGRRCVHMAGDLAEEEHCRQLVAHAAEALGRIDILVNNAAYQGPAVLRFEDLTRQRLEHTFQVNVIAMFSLVRHALSHMPAGSCIVNVASVQAYQPRPAILDYASTKGAIVSFTKGLALELIERGIRVNAVAPGPVWTPLIAQSFPEAELREFGTRSPMGRPAQPAELAPSFVFLASHEGRFINGEVLGVTGGQILG